MNRTPIDFSHPTLYLPRLPQRLDGLRVCHLSDFHSGRFADYGSRIAAGVRDFRPELIVVTGDMADCTMDCGASYFFSVIDRLSGYPTVLSPGNHELRIGKQRMPERLLEACAKRSLPLLYNRSVELELRGETLKIYGYLQGFRWVQGRRVRHARLRQDIDAQAVERALGPCPRDRFSILLAHDPAPFPAYEGWGAPLVLSGHIHGGMIRLPLLGGLLSPAHTFFPKYCAGVYQRGESTMYVSRGLGVGGLPRINNRPEVALLTLRAGETENGSGE